MSARPGLLIAFGALLVASGCRAHPRDVDPRVVFDPPRRPLPSSSKPRPQPPVPTAGDDAFPPLRVRSLSTDEVLYEGPRPSSSMKDARTFDLPGFGRLQIDRRGSEAFSCRATYEAGGWSSLAIYESSFCNAGVAEDRFVCFDAARLALTAGPAGAPHRELRVDGCVDTKAHRAD